MKRNILRQISFAVLASYILCIAGSDAVADEQNSSSAYVTDYKQELTDDGLYVSGTLNNDTGFTLADVVIEGRAYDKNNNLVSTDLFRLSPSKIAPKEKVIFSMVFTKNKNQIASCYLIGKYSIAHDRPGVDWAAIKGFATTVMLVAAAVAVGAAAAYDTSNGLAQQQYDGNMRIAADLIQSRHLVRVRGYMRLDGTYVRPHYRTAPDDYIWNNLSSQDISYAQ